VRFAPEPEIELFAASVRGVVSGWKPLTGEIGEWRDERDDGLAARLAELGWAELWAGPELLGPTVAGAVELGRALAPLHLVDEPTLGAPLGVGTRARHAHGRSHVVLAAPASGLVLVPCAAGSREPALDAVGTLVGLGGADAGERLEDASSRWRAWTAATLGYLAGVADALLERTVEHVRSREQFGEPLGALPAVRARLADAAVARDGVLLVAWESADPEREQAIARAELAWAGRACRDVTASALQAHGAIAFALESGLHRFYRRAKTVQAWTDAVLAATEAP